MSELTVTTTAYFEGLKLSDLLYQIMFEIGQVRGGQISYDKFPRKFIVQKLNNRLNQFVFHSQCIRKTAILRVKEGYGQYKLPVNCMDGGVVGTPRYYMSSDSYQPLYIRDVQWLDDHFQGWRTDENADPQYSYMGDSYGNIGMLGVYPKPDADGTSYAISPDTGVVTGGDIPGATSNVNGVATGGTGSELDDTAVDFTTMGLVAGMTILNVTDGSSCSITVVAAHAITTTALSGGSDNTWTVGDSYNILAGEYGVITAWDDDDLYVFSSEVGEVANITVPAGNIQIDFIPYPLPFPETGNDDQYPEIPKLHHMALAMGVVADLLNTFNEKTKEFGRADKYDKQFWGEVELAKRKKKSRPFDDKPVQIVPRRRGFRNN